MVLPDVKDYPRIKPGETRTFYSEVEQEDLPPEQRLRRFTGQEVTVVRHLGSNEYDGPGTDEEDDAGELSRMFVVRASDGTEFQAWWEELSGWDRDLGQFFDAEGNV